MIAKAPLKTMQDIATLLTTGAPKRYHIKATRKNKASRAIAVTAASDSATGSVHGLVLSTQNAHNVQDPKKPEELTIKPLRSTCSADTILKDWYSREYVIHLLVRSILALTKIS